MTDGGLQDGTARNKKRAMAVSDLANPTRFLAVVERMLPWLIAATALVFALGINQALFVAPDDYQQGATVKIMFLHVPSAWLAMFCWGLMSVAPRRLQSYTFQG